VGNVRAFSDTVRFAEKEVGMAHAHGDHTVIDRDGGYGAGLMVGIAIVLVLAVVALALLFTQPWDDDGGTNPTPGVEDVVPGEGGGDVAPGDGGTGGDGNGNDGGSGGGESAPQQ
jgi:hypothetical protein